MLNQLEIAKLNMVHCQINILCSEKCFPSLSTCLQNVYPEVSSTLFVVARASYNAGLCRTMSNNAEQCRTKYFPVNFYFKCFYFIFMHFKAKEVECYSYNTQELSFFHVSWSSGKWECQKMSGNVVNVW